MARKKLLFKNFDFLYESSAKQLTKAELQESDYLKRKIEKDIKLRRAETVAYLGPNGSGKTTVINYVADSLKEKIIYVPYEIWQYQDESKSWKNFLISILSKDAQVKNKNKIAKKLQQGRIKIFPLIVLIILGLASAILSFVDIQVGSQFINIGSIAFSALGLSAISYLSSRIIVANGTNYIYQYEDELLKILSKEKLKPILVEIEDIDRSIHGEKIIESLHVFINNHRGEIKRTFIVLCPMAKESFYGVPVSYGDTSSKKKRLERIELSNKIYDYVIDSKLSNKIIEEELLNVLESAGCTSERLMIFFKKLLPTIKRDSSLISIRAIKFILRDVDQFIQKYPMLDEVIACFHIVSKYIENNTNRSFDSGHVINMTLISGTGVNGYNTNMAYVGLVGYTFEIEELIKEHSRPNSNFTIPVRFNYLDNTKAHSSVFIEANNSNNIAVSLSNRYRELL